MHMTGSRCRLTADDVVAAYRLHHRLSRRWLVVVVFVGILILFQFYSGVRIMLQSGAVYWPALIMGFAILFLFVNRWILLPRRARRIFQEQKSLQGEFEVTISNDVFASVSDYGATRQPWDDFVRWKEDPDVILLYQSRALFQILPKRVVTAEEMGQFRMFLGKQLGPAA